MLALSSLSMFLQGTPVNPGGTRLDLLTIFVGIIALFFFLLMVGMAFGAIYAMKMVKEVKIKIGELEKRGEAMLAQVTAKATPFVDKAHEIMADLTPKIKNVSADVEAMSKTVRSKVEEVGATVSQINGTVQDANGKTRNQVARVDGIVTGALNTTHDVSNKIQAGIKYPINHVAGWIAGIKTGLETLAKKSSFNKPKTEKNPYDL